MSSFNRLYVCLFVCSSVRQFVCCSVGSFVRSTFDVRRSTLALLALLALLSGFSVRSCVRSFALSLVAVRKLTMLGSFNTRSLARM